MDHATLLWIQTYRAFFPRLKAGVRILLDINPARDFYIGTPIRGLLYSDSPIASLLKVVNGQLPVAYFLERALDFEDDLVQAMRELVITTRGILIQLAPGPISRSPPARKSATRFFDFNLRHQTFSDRSALHSAGQWFHQYQNHRW